MGMLQSTGYYSNADANTHGDQDQHQLHPASMLPKDEVKQLQLWCWMEEQVRQAQYQLRKRHLRRHQLVSLTSSLGYHAVGSPVGKLLDEGWQIEFFRPRFVDFLMELLSTTTYY
eukprot:TRINITY_DN7375_c1_g2_i1.p2 TRINITY_DN7375_c1_g2~~TRINITY_DN7375_c1_g2_i1.p2  ORF type:complete len:115 (-),score=8.51 TRINITY_DN7375_c1_g2_i1:3-347(-)